MLSAQASNPDSGLSEGRPEPNDVQKSAEGIVGVP